jgi:hypothetical protein
MYSHSKFKDYLSLIEKALNVKVEEIAKEKKKLPAPLGHHLKIFEYNNKKDFKSDQFNL